MPVSTQPSQRPRHQASPEGVPSDAVFDREAGGWASVPLDEAGQPHGEYSLYRQDGSLMLRGDYRSGQREGRFLGYHPNGDLASEGEYRNGRLQGVFVRHASNGPSAIPLRGCCVPAGARTMELQYDDGRVVRETFRDDAGHALLSDGTRRPARPSTLEERADFEESSRRWVLREELDDGVSLRRYFDVDGNRVEEAELLAGRRIRTRSYALNEVLIEAREFDDKGKLRGAYYRHHQLNSPYTDARIVSERGHFEQGHPIGQWQFLDADGVELRQVDRGSLPSSTEWEAALAEPFESDQQRRDAVRSAFAQSRVRIGLLLAARTLGKTLLVEDLAQWLDRVVVRTGERQDDAWRQVFARTQVDIDVAMDGLLSGADPADALRVVATLAPEGSAAALELVEASLTLRPSDMRTLANRAMLRLESGDVRGTREDADTLRARGEDQVAAQLEETAQLLFSPLIYSPSTEPPQVCDPALPEVPFDQPLDAVRRVLRMYATRMTRARDVLCKQVPHLPSWLPEVPKDLLVDGPVELDRRQVTIVDETDEGTEESQVLVDETEGLDAPSALRAMTTLRADWAATCWLCWAVGLDRVGLPRAIVPPPSLPTVLNETMVRCFRVHDQLRTRGLASRTKGIPAFVWEGRSIDRLSRTLCQVAAREYLERRAVLFWALFSQNISPFQSDLRKV